MLKITLLDCSEVANTPPLLRTLTTGFTLIVGDNEGGGIEHGDLKDRNIMSILEDTSLDNE